MLLLSCKILSLLAVLVGIVFLINSEAHDRTISRPPTAVEKKQVKDALTGWDTAFRNHK